MENMCLSRVKMVISRKPSKDGPDVRNVSNTKGGAEFAADLLLKRYHIRKFIGKEHTATRRFCDRFQPNPDRFQILVPDLAGKTLIDEAYFFGAWVPIHRDYEYRNELAFDQGQH
jgi:hypothetical protein